MKKWILAAALAAISTAANAQYGGYGSNSGGYGTGSNSQSHSVGGYTTNNGTYVQAHQQTNPNNTTSDNYGTRPNVNPYTGAVGTHRGY